MSLSKASKSALKYGYKSGLEGIVAEQLRSLGLEPNYEAIKLSYMIPESWHHYTPDFLPKKSTIPSDFVYRFKDGGVIFIETKGRFVLADRKKSLLVRSIYFNLDLRFVFTNSKAKISKGSKTTYGMWCEKNGFKYADKLIPAEWIEEIKNAK